MRYLIAFIRLGRPLFLAGGIVMHALGVLIALERGASLNLAALLWGQIAITAVQWMTHYSNDYFDLEADRANHTPTNWSGGSRVLTERLIAPRLALIASLVLAGLALFASLVLVFGIGTGTLTLPLIGLALALAWFYSAPPLRLHSRGVGELTTALIVPGLAPLTGFYLQRGQLELLPFLAVFPLALLQIAMLLAIEFPDEAGDRAVGKRTLVVRLGARRAARLYISVLALTYVSLPILVFAGLPTLVCVAVLGMLPLAFRLARMTREIERPARWNLLAFNSIALLFATAALEAFAFALLVGMTP